jgi:IS5 family transposase
VGHRSFGGLGAFAVGTIGSSRSRGGGHVIVGGGDKNYDTADCVEKLRGLNVTPHVAQNDTHRRSAIDQRTTRHPGYLISQKKRKRVEEIFGWLKTVGGVRKLRHRGLERVNWMFTFAVAAYNLVRIRNLGIAE